MAIWLPALLVVVCFWGEVSYAQEERDLSTISSISVLLDGQLADEDFSELIPIKVGDSFSLKSVNDSIKQIHKSGLFSNVQVLKEGSEEVYLTYLLKGKVLARKIHFIGAESIPRKRLDEQLISMGQGDPFSEIKLAIAIEELREALREEGDFQASIRAYTEEVPDSSRVDIFFQVQSVRHYRVADIAVSGNIILSEKELKDKMTTKVGEKYIPALLKKDIERLKELYVSRDYQRVEISLGQESFNHDSGQVTLRLEIEPHEKIVLKITGADVPLNLIQPIWEARIFEEWGLDEGEAKIKGYLRNKGYLFSVVDSSIEEKNNEIHVIYKVTRGEKYGIEDVSFQGLTYYTPDRLREELLIREKVLFLGKIDGARLFEIPYDIEFLYKTQGFPETRVDLSFEKVGRKVRPVYFIEEGRQEKVEEVTFVGVSLFPQEKLLQEISSYQDQPFYQPSIQRDIEKIEEYYLNEGVRGSKIRVAIQNLGDDRFSIIFQVEEGERVTIENIVITGNNVTRKNTIIHELLIKSGDLARFDLIRETKRRLERLGVFSEVKIEEIVLSNQRMNLLVKVAEGERNYVSLGLGLETKKEPRSFEVWNNEVRLRGTAELIRNNILGTAAQLSLVGQISIREKRAVASWQQPYFFGIPLRPVLNAWIEREERTSYSYDRRGISLSGIKSLSSKEDLVLLTTLRFARTKLLTLNIEESGVDRQFFPYSTTSLSESLIWDRRSDPFNPESGHFFSSVVEWAYPLFNTESDFLKTFTKYQQYFQLWPDVVCSVTARLGLGRGRMPIHERFFAGGSNSFRGARFDELGPRDPDSDKPVGGKSLVLVNFELTFPIFSQLKNLFGVVFYDKGNVFSQRRQTAFAGLEDALGLGLHYRTPLGPVRLELGWNPSPPEGKNKVLLFFTIGNLF